MDSGPAKLRILFFTENFPPEVNAAATRVYERAVYWAREGHSVCVVTCFPNFPQGRLHEGWRQRPWQSQELDGLRIVRVPTYIARNEGFVRRTLDFASFMVTGTLASLFVGKPDVIVATSPQFFTAVAGWLASSIKRAPFVFELGDLWPASIRAVGALRDGWLYRMLEYMELFLYERAAAVVALTPAFQADLISRGIEPRKIKVVINGVDLPRYAPRGRDTAIVESLQLEGCFTVGYIGTHGAAHGLKNVLEAASLLREDSSLRFLFVGDGADKPALIAAAQTQSLSSVTFVEPQPKGSMPQWWSVCDVALVHLKNDPVFQGVIPSKIFEAMAMGLPILLVAPSGEASRVIEETGAGVVVPAGEPAALANAIRRLKDDPGLRERLARASLSAAPNYSRRRQAEDMMRVLTSVAAARR